MRNNQSRIGNRQPQQAPSPAPVQSNLSFAVPTEFVELPSKGAFYPSGHPLHNQETVEIKFMTAKEEDILSSTALLKKGLALDRLMENILVLDIDPTDLLVCDRNAIMIAARISSYGSDYNAGIVCPHCSSDVEYTFDLNKKKMNDTCFDPEFVDGVEISLDQETGLFDIVLPKTQATVTVRMLTGKDEKFLTDVDDNHVVTSTLSTFIVAVNGETNGVALASFIENMPASDSKYLRKVYGMVSPSIDLKQVFVCPACFENKEMEVPLTAEFFWPG